MSDLKELQTQTQGFSLLYVEDNNALRKNAGKLFRKFFSDVDLAKDGEEGVELFRQKHHQIVVTDIKMPRMDGMTLSENIQKIHPQSKVIVMSAFDDKDILLKGIKFGVFRFLKKPVNINELSKVLREAVDNIKHEEHVQMFQAHLQNIFKNQSSMVILLNESKIILANDAFLNFFNFESLQECQNSSIDIGEFFLPHSGFLYNHDDIDALELIKQQPDKLYNIKIENENGKIFHFIIKYQIIPEKEGYGIVSFDDVTELNFLELFNEVHKSSNVVLPDQEALFEFLSVIQRNSAKVELHNYYKGLSITNDASICDIDDEKVILKTTYIQEKAVQIEKKTLIVSDALPYALEASHVEKINFEREEITLSGLRFVQTSPITRKTIRVIPSGKQSVTLFLGEGKFQGNVKIEDISLDAVKLKLSTLPPALDKDAEVTLDIVLELDKRALIVNTRALFLRKKELRDGFSVVFIFKDLKRSELIKYITKRQMALIREIKGMQNG